ncbi:MAG: hypothetical protein AB1599_10465 [Planctomycetota bacterium]
MDDLIQLGAYVVIILIIGGASVIKKIIEAQKRRKEMQERQGKTLRLEPTGTQTTPVITVESEEEIPAPEAQNKPKIEDILKDIFNIPTVPLKRETVIKDRQRKQRDMLKSVKKMQTAAAMVQEAAPAPTETVTANTEANWEVFAVGLKRRGLTEIQQAVVMSELIQKPRARRRI